MVEYLLRLLQHDYPIATLSRGYKRKTKGYVLAHASTTALEIGDEPMQFHAKFPNVAVAVGEERIAAIPQLLHDTPGTQVIILDDAFQHRAIQPGLNILLTEYNNLFTRDFFLPTGDLRDQRSSYKRAQVIVVTKCPAELSETERRSLLKEINPLSHQKVFFTAIEYGIPYHIITREPRVINANDEILLVCGIANPRPLKQYLLQHAKTYDEQMYGDHHIFSIDDLQEIEKKFQPLQGDKLMITTEKDAMRLVKFRNELLDMPMFVLPVQHHFLFGEGTRFDEVVHTFIKGFYENKK